MKTVNTICIITLAIVIAGYASFAQADCINICAEAAKSGANISSCLSSCYAAERAKKEAEEAKKAKEENKGEADKETGFFAPRNEKRETKYNVTPKKRQ